jgi:F0F1-type ATP synthase assembly protein I
MTHDPYNAPSGSSAMGSGSSAMGGASAGMSSGATAGGTRSTGAADQSVGQLLSDISADMSTLMRQELELAKAELRQEASLATTAAKEEASKAGKAAAMFGAAGYIGHFAFLFVSLALWWLIRHILGDGTHWGWAFLIVAVLYGIIAAVLALSGKKKMKDVNFGRLSQINPKPEQTIETLQEVPGALKPSN